MTSGLAWLNDLMIWLGRWFPRLVLIKATHEGVKFSRGGAVTTMKPGLYIYWPITSEVTLVSTRVRTDEISAQLIGREVVSIATMYCIADPKVALLAFNCVFSQMDDRAQARLTANYSPDKSNSQIEESVLADLQSEFGPNGIEVKLVSVIQRGRAIPLKNIGDWASHSKREL